MLHGCSSADRRVDPSRFDVSLGFCRSHSVTSGPFPVGRPKLVQFLVSVDERDVLRVSVEHYGRQAACWYRVVTILVRVRLQRVS